VNDSPVGVLRGRSLPAVALPARIGSSCRTVAGALPWWAVALLTGDIALIGLDVLQRNGLLDDPRFLVTYERGYGEILQYLKGAALGAGLVVLAWSRRSLAAAVLAGIIGWMVLDDAFMLHERGGLRMAAWLGLSAWPQLRPEDLGELLLLACVGALAAASLLFTWRCRPACEQPTLAAGALGLLALGFFGVGMDLVHSLAPRGHWVRSALAVVEDGGEMLALTAMAAAMFLVHRRAP
jgi:hypothetical protein